MNAEEMKQRATIEYAVREMNNVIQSARKEKTNIRTSMSYCYSMKLFETDDLDCLDIMNGMMEVSINKPVALDYCDKIGFYSDDDPCTYVKLDVETVLGWLEQIQKEED